jgi:site-specific DNA recombinase
MYVYQHSQAYACKQCKNRITVADLDDIYRAYLKDYLGSINHSTYLASADRELQKKKVLLETVKKDRTKLAKQADDQLALRLGGEMNKELFAEKYKPVEERIMQLDSNAPELEAKIDARTIQLMSSDIVVADIRTLYDRWEEMAFEQKRGIIETITRDIEIDTQDITITLAYAPSLCGEMCTDEHSSVHISPAPECCEKAESEAI